MDKSLYSQIGASADAQIGASADAQIGASADASFRAQVARGERFRFGENWRAFLSTLNEERIRTAEASLREMLETDSLAGKTFLDAGSGSGLFSLAARRLGAKVHSVDFDPSSVWCTRELRRRYFADDAQWTVEEASVLDAAYLQSLGSFDVVYSWGVLHHTGRMWQALDLVACRVAPGGKLFISIYNWQERWSDWWKAIKAAYCRAPRYLKPLVLYPAAAKLWGPRMVKDLVLLRPLHSWRNYAQVRGMSPWHDVIDWVGGYPFEAAKPEQIFDFCRARGFVLCRLTTDGGGLGTNQYVFELARPRAAPD